MLCSACVDILRTAQKRAGRHRRTKTLGDLFKSINEKCYPCTRLRLSINHEEWQQFSRLSGNVGVPVQYSAQSYHDISYIQMESSCGESGKCSLHLIRNVVGAISIPSVPYSRTLSGISKHPVLEVAQLWLDDCRENHLYCRQDTESPLHVPERLMDLQPEGLVSSMWRLRNTVDTNIKEPYATLSHRWGSQTISLNLQTEKSMMKGQLVESLPPVYADAVRIAKQLGIRYLWIDSLCIRQDGTFDILNQAARMAEVYGNALFNISALTARQDGIISPPGEADMLLSQTIFDRLQYQFRRSYMVEFENSWTAEVRDAPLLRRGWVMQEQLLAQRTIYFGALQAFWECATCRRCSGQPTLAGINWGTMKMEDFVREGTIGNHFDYMQHSLQLASAAINNGNTAERMATYPHPNLSSHHWTALVEVYCKRKLTNSGDKLLAIAGIAKLFRSLVDDEYLAGVWKNQLPLQLLWIPKKDDDTMAAGTVPQSQCAPSWSWASVDCEIDYTRLTRWKPRRIVAQLLQAEVDGIWGRIRLRCPIIPMFPDEDNMSSPNGSGFRFASDGIVPQVPKAAFDSEQNIQEFLKPKPNELIFAILTIEQHYHPNSSGPDFGKIEDAYMNGILLMRRESLKKDRVVGEYIRVGAARLWKPGAYEWMPDVRCIPKNWHGLFRDRETSTEPLEENFLDFNAADYLTTIDIV